MFSDIEIANPAFRGVECMAVSELCWHWPEKDIKGYVMGALIHEVNPEVIIELNFLREILNTMENM